MKRIILLSVLSIIFIQLSAQNDTTVFEFYFPKGISAEFFAVSDTDYHTAKFPAINISNSVIIISSFKSSCGCLVPYYTKEPITPGDTVTFTGMFNPTGKCGRQHKTLNLLYSIYENRQSVSRHICFPLIYHLPPCRY